MRPTHARGPPRPLASTSPFFPSLNKQKSHPDRSLCCFRITSSKCFFFYENRHVERHLPNPSAPKNSPKMKTLLRPHSLNLPSNLQIRQAYSPEGRQKRGERKRQRRHQLNSRKVRPPRRVWPLQTQGGSALLFHIPSSDILCLKPIAGSSKDLGKLELRDKICLFD